MSNILTVEDGNFQQEVLDSEKPVIVDFWATWCVPCKAIEPVVEKLAEEYKEKIKVVRINVDNSQKTPAKFGIRGIPTILMFKNGRVMGQLVGAVPKRKLEELFTKALEN